MRKECILGRCHEHADAFAPPPHAAAPSPLERARTVGGEVSALLLRAARWSERTHELFPASGRAQAVALLRLGYLLASARAPHQAAAFCDVWREYVLPHAITRV